jgi:hypothetical protein
VIYTSQQLKLRRWVDDRGLEVVRIGKSNCDADAVPFMKPVRNGMQTEDQFNRLFGCDSFQIALIMGVKG